MDCLVHNSLKQQCTGNDVQEGGILEKEGRGEGVSGGQESTLGGG